MLKAGLTLLGLAVLTTAAYGGDLTGYWGVKGCRANPNEDAYVLSRRTNGRLNISSNEWGCDLMPKGKSGNTLTFHAECSGEGNDPSGILTIGIKGPNTIVLRTPGEGPQTLHRCS